MFLITGVARKVTGVTAIDSCSRYLKRFGITVADLGFSERRMEGRSGDWGKVPTRDIWQKVICIGYY